MSYIFYVPCKSYTSPEVEKNKDDLETRCILSFPYEAREEAEEDRKVWAEIEDCPIENTRLVELLIKPEEYERLRNEATEGSSTAIDKLARGILAINDCQTFKVKNNVKPTLNSDSEYETEPSSSKP